MQLLQDDSSMNTRNKILDEISERAENKSDFYMVMSTGSSRHDIDLFVVLSNDSNFSKELYDIVDVIRETQQNLLQSNILLSVFPEFTKEVTDEYLSKENNIYSDSNEHQQLHLLIYPSYDLFVEWEDPMLIKRATASGEILIGNEEHIRERAEELPIPSLQERISASNLLPVLLNNYQMLHCSMHPKQIKLKEITKKTSYTIRYLSFEHLLENGYNIDQILTWEDIYKKSDHLQEPLGDICEIGYEWWRDSHIANKNTLEKINNKCISIVESDLANDCR